MVRNDKGRFTPKHIDDREAGELEKIRDDAFNKWERSVRWNPTTTERMEAYRNLCIKNAKQQQKTLDEEGRGVEHSRGMKEWLRRMKKWYEAEAKRMQDKIDDGGR